MTTDNSRRQFLLAAGALGVTFVAGCASDGDGEGSPTTGEMGGDGMTETPMDEGMNETTMEGEMMATSFTVRVENVSAEDTLQTMDGPVPALLSPLAWAVHGEDVALFTPDEAASAGLEMLAEDGSPATLVEEVSMSVEKAGAVTTPEGADEPGPIGPGGAYTFSVEAHAGQRLSLATMFVQSNDLFYAPEPSGIALFDGEEPVDGDVTDAFLLWDAGTEENEEPGVGENQAPRQSGPDTGPDENGTVRRIADVDDGYDYPETGAVLKVTVSPGMMDG